MQKPCHYIYMLNTHQTCSNVVTEIACWYPTRHAATLSQFCMLVSNQTYSNLVTIFTCWIPIRHAATLPPYLHAEFQSDMQQPCHHICMLVSNQTYSNVATKCCFQAYIYQLCHIICKLVSNQTCSNLATIFTCWIPIRHAAILSLNVHAGIQPGMQQPCHHFACWNPIRHTATLSPHLHAGIPPDTHKPCHNICKLVSNQTCSNLATIFTCWIPIRHDLVTEFACWYPTRHTVTLPPYVPVGIQLGIYQSCHSLCYKMHLSQSYLIMLKYPSCHTRYCNAFLWPFRIFCYIISFLVLPVFSNHLSSPGHQAISLMSL